MPDRRPPSEQDEKRLRADLASLRQNSEWAKARRRERIRWVITIAIAIAAARWLPWHELKDSLLEKAGVEILAPDAGTR